MNTYIHLSDLLLEILQWAIWQTDGVEWDLKNKTFISSEFLYQIVRYCSNWIYTLIDLWNSMLVSLLWMLLKFLQWRIWWPKEYRIFGQCGEMFWKLFAESIYTVRKTIYKDDLFAWCYIPISTWVIHLIGKTSAMRRYHHYWTGRRCSLWEIWMQEWEICMLNLVVSYLWRGKHPNYCISSRSIHNLAYKNICFS